MITEVATTPVVAHGLVGRDRELTRIIAFLDGTAVDGGALLLSGEAGVGKSAILDAGADAAERIGARVVRASGAQSEADVSFAALHQILVPFSDQISRLPSELADALHVALGFRAGTTHQRLVVSNAALALLSSVAAAEGPLLVILDDVQWLDRSSADVMAFVARRLAGSRVGFLAARRSGSETFLTRPGIPEFELPPLDDEAAASLLRARFPTLAPRVLQRVVVEAGGNPLALLELTSALSSTHRAALGRLPPVLPLGPRLQALGAARLAEVPARTRQLLLLAVLGGTGDLRVLEDAATGHARLQPLPPSVRARLVFVDDSTGRLVFHHPLMRSVIAQSSTSDERRRAHVALAGALTDEPDRQAWHLAEATLETDDHVADLLEETARRALRKGDGVGAVAALTRAADLSADRSIRARRLAEAAYMGAHVTGDLAAVEQLLAQARATGAGFEGSVRAAAAAAFVVLNGDGEIDTAHRLLLDALERRVGCDDDVAAALGVLLLACYNGGRLELWEHFHDEMTRLAARAPADLQLVGELHCDPVRGVSEMREQIDAAIASLHDEVDSLRIGIVSTAALNVDRLTECRAALWRVARDGRAGGAVNAALTALMYLSRDAYLTGQWALSQQLADEGLALCRSHRYRMHEWSFWHLQANLAAARGDGDTARALTDEIVQWAVPRNAVLTVRHYPLALAALGRGDFEAAYQHATAISPPGLFAPHVPHALWIVLDLVEAAVRTDRRAEANAHVAAMRDRGIGALSPRTALLVEGSAAIAAPDDEAAFALFERAVALPCADQSPFPLARVQLAFGERLRRARATSESRVQLGAALSTFERLDARPWVARAATELRAAGVGGSPAARSGDATLTAQEREIALMAASGLTNKEIASQLFLSPRTVGAHLYRIFPKLYITSRAALRDALAAMPA